MKAMKWLLQAMFLFVLMTALTVACGDDDDDDDDDDDASEGDDDDSTTDDDDDDDDTDGSQWEWQAIPGAICRDGSDTGLGIRLNPDSDKLMIWLQDGGACYDQDSCDDNPSTFGATQFASWASSTGETGVFDNTNEANPMQDWNFVMVPYCTGDVHAGSLPDGWVPGLDDKQQFVGYTNMTLFLDKLGVDFADASAVFFSGSSAGGFGSIINYPHVAETFAPTPVIMLDDSGPLPEDDDVLAPCYQLLLTFIYDVQVAIDDTGYDPIQVNGDGFSDYMPWFATAYPNASFGLFSYTKDSTIRDFFGFGQNNCTGGGPIPEQMFEDAMLDYRDNFLAPTGKWGTYYVEGDSHVILTQSTFYTMEVGGVLFTDWLADLIAGTVAQVGP